VHSHGMCETEAIRSAQKGDPAGMGRLYELHKSKVYGLCLRYTNNAFDAEDLTHEVFLQVSRKVGTYRGEAQFKTWLCEVALNMVRLHARRKRREDLFVIEPPADVMSRVHARNYNPAQTVALKRALATLTLLRRQTVLLHDIEGFTHEEIASRMSATVVASKSRLHQAHRALRSTLGQRYAYSFPNSKTERRGALSTGED